MTRHALTTIQDCEDFVSGCLFMGTGGGGGVDWGLGMLRAALEDGLPLEWTDLADIPDDAWTCTAFGMGSIAPQDDSTAWSIDSASTRWRRRCASWPPTPGSQSR
jgi:hypothetical protein